MRDEKKDEECSSSATFDDGRGNSPDAVREKFVPLFGPALGWYYHRGVTSGDNPCLQRTTGVRR